MRLAATGRGRANHTVGSGGAKGEDATIGGMRRRFLRLCVVLLPLLATVVTTALAVLLFGVVSGEEFTPDTFSRRSYHYVELPWLRIPLSPVRRREHRSELEQLLVDQQYVAVSGPPYRWDLVLAQRGGTMWREGDARILCIYLDARDPYDSLYGLDWTRANPALARLFWPQIASLARRELYLYMPELFVLAQTATDPEQFRQDIDRTVQERLRP